MKRLLPDTLFARTLLVLLIGLALSHAISIALYVSDRSSTLLLMDGRHMGDRIAIIDRIVRSAPPEERAAIVENISDDMFRVSLDAQGNVSASEETGRKAREVEAALVEHLDRDENRIIRVRDMGEQAADGKSGPGERDLDLFMVSMSIPDQGWLNFIVPLKAPQSLWTLRYVLSMAVMLGAIVLFSAIVVHQLTDPLARFARASRRLGVDMNSRDIPEEGAAEIRQAARAFNQMHRRIRRFVEDRTQMIAAISHDLGTPISRMRLRAEFVDDEEQRTRMLRDLDDMEKMVSDTMSFARDETMREPVSKVDFGALLQRVCDDVHDAGHDVELVPGERPLPFDCRPAAMRRALGNLIENAARYGRKARVMVRNYNHGLVVCIDDEGPGIPSHLHEKIFEPFYRLETSRSRQTGGTGLGMTVARSIIRAHGGDISLENRKEGGLRMEITLPATGT